MNTRIEKWRSWVALGLVAAALFVARAPPYAGDVTVGEKTRIGIGDNEPACAEDIVWINDVNDGEWHDMSKYDVIVLVLQDGSKREIGFRSDGVCVWRYHRGAAVAVASSDRLGRNGIK